MGIPAKQIFIGTHSHTSPEFQGMADKIFAALKTENGNAARRMGYGTGVAYINANRNMMDPKTHMVVGGANYEGPSDKTVAVIKFETPTGDRIAVYYNYACHVVTVGRSIL